MKDMGEYSKLKRGRKAPNFCLILKCASRTKKYPKDSN
jgi:hypothetical protein